jgi:hypothetical protein
VGIVKSPAQEILLKFTLKAETCLFSAKTRMKQNTPELFVSELAQLVKLARRLSGTIK